MIVLSRIKKTIYRLVVGIKKWMGAYPSAIIASQSECGDKVAVYIDETNELVQMIPVYKFINKGSFELHVHEISLYKYKNAKVFYDSDMVLVGDNKMVWPKFYNYNFSKNLVRDNVYIENDNRKIIYKNYKVKKHYKVVFSMLGRFSQVWAHAIVEYLPKLAMLEYAIQDSNSKVTVLIPEYKDPQLKEVMLDELRKYNVEIDIVKPKEAITADLVYYLERPAFFTDHEESVSIADQYIPYRTVDEVRKLLVNKYTKDVKTKEEYKNIFLPRRGGLGKGIINEKEIEGYFKNKGYYFVEPHKLSLKEKIEVFQSAENIVGPFGSAFTNLVFCRPGTKVLCFSNYQRLFENYFSMPLQHFGINILYIMGYDNKHDNPAHCSFILSLNEVVSAAKSIGILDE